jgi:hypothetical protein
MEAAELSALLSLPGMESAPLQSSTNSIFILHVYSFFESFFSIQISPGLANGPDVP